MKCDGCLAGTTGLGHTLRGAGGERVYREEIFSEPSIPEELVQGLRSK